MRTLITGLNGFTGCYLQQQLTSQGHEVVGLSSDLRDVNALSSEIDQLKPDYVVHLAGIAFVGEADANLFYDVNLLGTRNLLAALEPQAQNIKSILLASSANVYGNESEGVLREDTCPAPTNDYAVSKLAMEHMAKLWVNKLPLFIVRPFNYTGVGQDSKFLIPKIVDHFKRREAVIELGNLEVWREFGDVRTVVSIYGQLLSHQPTGMTINICTGKTYSLREVVGLCKKITGHSIEVEVNPAFVRENEVRVLTGDDTLLNEFRAEDQVYELEDTLRWMLGQNH